MTRGEKDARHAALHKAFRRQHEAELVERWIVSLKADLRDADLRLARMSESERTFFLDHVVAERENDAALLELLQRGLDPDRGRRFRGRIVLTIRCVTKGHVLGCVYPTATFAIFVPVVSALPLRRRNESRPRRNLEREGLQAQLIQISTGVDRVEALARARAQSNRSRDIWIEEHKGPRSDEGSPGIGYIRGLEVLSDSFFDPREVDHETRKRIGYGPDEPIDVAMYLYCRCGERYLRLEPLRAALANGDRVLTA